MPENKEYEDFLSELKDNLRQIQSNTLMLNEGDENDKKDDDKNDDMDLDALLKSDDNEEDNDSSKSDNKDDSGDNLNLDDLDLGDKDSQDSSDNDKSSEGESDSENDDNKSFETDSEGLMDTITKLTKSGHTVKILITSEGRQYLFNGKPITAKKLIALGEMLYPSLKSSKKTSNNRAINALMEQINSLRKEIKGLKNGSIKPVSEDKIIKIKNSEYNTLIEGMEDLIMKVDEQEAIIKRYESMDHYNSLTEDFDNDVVKSLDELSESIDALNNLDTGSLSNINNLSYNKGAENVFNIMTETILPTLKSLSDTKATILNEMSASERVNSYRNNIESNNYISTDIQESLNKLNSISESINSINTIDKVKMLVESKMSANTKFSKNDFMKILTEATSDIVAFDNNPDYKEPIPTIDPFEKRVYNTLNSALAGANKSVITVIPEDEGNLVKKSEIDKFDLPIARPDKYNPNTTVKSAIMQLNEALTDIDGNLDINMCKKAYLYTRVKNPTSIKDFAFPIALVENNQLYAHPKLIESAANMLSTDKAMRTYNIPSRRELEVIRESLMPYLKELNIEAPWLKDLKIK